MATCPQPIGHAEGLSKSRKASQENKISEHCNTERSKIVKQNDVAFFWDEDYKGYIAEAVGLPGCFSQGKTMEEAIGNIKDAIKGYLYVERKHKKKHLNSSEK